MTEGEEDGCLLKYAGMTEWRRWMVRIMRWEKRAPGKPSSLRGIGEECRGLETSYGRSDLRASLNDGFDG